MDYLLGNILNNNQLTIQETKKQNKNEILNND